MAAKDFIVKNGLQTPNIKPAGGANTLTVPATTGTIVTTGDTGTVTNTMLAGSIAPTKLSNRTVTVGSTGIDVGGAAVTTIAGLSSVTSTSFVGSLTGNATSVTNGVYTTGSYADPAWITSLAYSKITSPPAINNGTLTLAVSGTGLSGSASFTANQSGNSTFTVTSNATSANTVSTIVARDASGNFSAGTITATLSGNASTVTNGVYTTGSYADPSWITSLAWAKLTGVPSFLSASTSSTQNGYFGNLYLWDVAGSPGSHYLRITTGGDLTSAKTLSLNIGTDLTLGVMGTVQLNVPTNGGVVFGAASGVFSSTGQGTAGYVLQANGGTNAPTWTNSLSTFTLTDPKIRSTIDVKNAGYSIVAGDEGKIIEMSAGGTLQIPAGLPVGMQVTVLQTGASQVTIAASGTTLNGTPQYAANTMRLRAQWSAATLIHRSTNVWVAIGDLTA